MPVFFLHDIRVAGATPQCDIAIQVNPSDYLGSMVEQLAERIARSYSEPAWFHCLHILCHGTPQGLQLGTPYASQLNVHTLFAPLRGKVGSVEIHGCGAAVAYNRGTPALGPYDGAAFCSGLARTIGASVTASDATQFYVPSNSITNSSARNQLARWQGRVGTWNAAGQLLNISTPEQRDL